MHDKGQGSAASVSATGAAAGWLVVGIVVLCTIAGCLPEEDLSYPPESPAGDHQPGAGTGGRGPGNPAAPAEPALPAAATPLAESPPPPESLPAAISEPATAPSGPAATLEYARAHVRQAGPAAAEQGVLLIGSSSIVGELGRVAATELGDAGYRVTSLGVSGTGLSRRDHFDWLAVAQGLKIPANPAGAVVYLGVNDAQTLTEPWPGAPAADPEQPLDPGVVSASADAPYDTIARMPGTRGPAMVRAGPRDGAKRKAGRRDGAPARPARVGRRASGSKAGNLVGAVPWKSPLWAADYQARVGRFIDTLCERGVPRVVLLLPVDVRPKALDTALRRIRAAQTNAAASSRCGVAVATEGDRPHFEAQHEKLRLADGFHLTAAGARVVWERIEPALTRLLGAAPTAAMMPRSSTPPAPASPAGAASSASTDAGLAGEVTTQEVQTP